MRRTLLTLLSLFVFGLLASTTPSAGQDLIHYWNFNNPDGGDNPWPQPISADIGTGEVNYSFAGDDIQSFSGTTVNAQNSDDEGDSFVVQDEDSNGEFFSLEIPSIGYENVQITYATRGTGSGFDEQQVSYSTDGGMSFTTLSTITNIPGSYQPRTIDLSGISATDDESDLIVRITLDGATAANGNNRFDNITVFGTPTSMGPVTNTNTGESFSTIQSAIDAADPGDEIEVSEGPFDEKVTINTENITLRGVSDGTGGSAVASKAAPTGAPVINGQVILGASGATLDGFVVSPPPATSNQTGEAIRIDSGADNVIVKNSTVRNFEENGIPQWEGLDGIVAFGGNGNNPIENVTILNNKVENIDGRDTDGGAAGISIQGNVNGADVTGNTVINIGMSATAWAYGIVVRGTGNDPALLPSDVEVTNNNVSSIRSDPASIYAGVGFGLEGGAASSVSGNTFTNTELQAEDKTLSFDLINDFIGENTLDGAVIIDDGSADGVKDETTPNEAQRVYSTISAPLNQPVQPTETVRAYSVTATYAENITIDKGLTLTGATIGGGGGASAAAKSSSCTATTVLDASGGSVGINVTASNVTITGLCVKDAQNHNIYTDAVISDLTLDGVEALNAGNYGFEVHNNATLSDLTVTGSRFAANNSGIRVRGNLSTAQISGTTFENNGIGFHTTQGLDATQPPSSSDVTSATGVTIESSTFTGNNNKSIYTEKLSNSVFDSITVTGGEVDINLKYQDYQGITIKNSSIKNVTTGTGLYVKARNDRSDPIDYNTVPATLSDLVISNNEVSGNTAGNGIALQYGIQDATITGNLIQNNGNDATRTDPDGQDFFFLSGLSIYGSQGANESGPDVTLSGLTIEDNCIVNNAAYDLLVGIQSSASVNAENNWWGTASGPDSGDDFTNGSPNIVSITNDGVNADPFSEVPLYEGCISGGDDPGCLASDFTETVNNQERRIEVVIEDPEGIQTVNFRNDNQNNSPLLENLTVELEEATGGTLERDDSSSDIDWSAGSTAPTRVVLHLNQENENVKSFAYYLRTTNGCGTETVIDPVGELPVSVDALSLQGNYPNPFSDRTTLAFALPEAADVTLTVYDVMGRKVATLQEGRLPAGAHEVRWDGRADGGTELASGLYIARLTAGDQTRTQRLTIVR